MLNLNKTAKLPSSWATLQKALSKVHAMAITSTVVEHGWTMEEYFAAVLANEHGSDTLAVA